LVAAAKKSAGAGRLGGGVGLTARLSRFHNEHRLRLSLSSR
jgi:hypothetical protein